MKKFLIFILILVTLGGVGYVIVQPRLPQWTLMFIMNRFERDDYALLFENLDVELAEEQEALVRKVLETFEYDILGSQVQGNEASVAVELTFVDISELVISNNQQVINNVLKNLGSALTAILSGDWVQLAISEIVTLLEDETIEIPMMTKEVDVPMHRSGFFWEPQLTVEWFLEAFEINELEGLINNLMR